MRFWAPLLALCAAVASAQSCTGNNCISIPQAGLQPVAGQPFTITWTNPSAGTVTIKLQQGSSITPNSGYILESGVSAAAGTATFTIPADVVNSSQYVLEIVDDSNSNNYNFSDNFVVSGATGTATAFPSSGASSTGTATGSSASSSASSVSRSASSSSASASSSSASSASSASSSSASASRSSSSSASSVSMSATASATTAAPNSNAAAGLKVQGGLVAFIFGAVALL